MNRALTLFAFSLVFSSPAAIAQSVSSQATTPEAQVRLGNDYLEKRDYAMAMTWFRKAADRGNAAAENNVGWLNENGFGVPQNYAQALNWYRKAADQGSASGMSSVGWFYNKGWGVKQDYAEALKWYVAAADKGDSYAENNLGALYEHGDGVVQDYVVAMAWYYRAANKGLALAETNLGLLYRDGHGVQQDYVKAASWFRKAAEQGNAKAQFYLGWLFDNGLGGQPDYALAMNWYRKAAEQNYADAENNIGWLYQKGLGVEQNSAEAITWYRKATDQGSALAKVNLASLLHSETGPAADVANSPEKPSMLTGGIQAPRVINNVDPEYSEAARKAMTEGTELLSVLVDANGKPQNVKVLTPLGYGLDENAVSAVKTWRFDPATKDGKPVAVQLMVEVTFRLYGYVIGKVDVDPDTGSTNIDSYLSPVIAEARKCWSRLSEDKTHSPGVKRGQLTIRFAISRDGHTQPTDFVSSSGDQLLDGIARDCIATLKLDKPLPSDLNGKDLVVKMQMLYNRPGLSINPSGARLTAGDKEQFYINTGGVLSQRAEWSVTGAGCTGDVCGTISPEGLYKAPSILPNPPFVRIKGVLQGANPLSASSVVMLFEKQGAEPQIAH